MKSFFDTVFQRRSVRSFTAEPVTEEELGQLLRAAMAAPTAVNRQPWEFVIIRTREKLDALAAALPYAGMARQALLGVVVCAVPAQAHEKRAEYAVIDASIACENLLLAAEALGLGAVWTALYPQTDRQAAARRLLGIPEEVIPLAFVPIGRPRGEGGAKDKFKEEKIHREQW